MKDRKFENILFDLDGTLTDSKEGIVNSILYALEKLDIQEKHIEELDNFIENISTFAECYGLTDELKDSFAENMSKAGDSFTELLPSSDNCVIEMGRENLVHYVLASETNDERIDLVTLVGLAAYGSFKGMK